MATTYEIISTVTVGAGGTSSISFSSIPNTYTDLAVLCSLRTSNTTSNYGEMIYMRLNSSTANFSLKRLEAYGSNVSTSNEVDGRIGRANNANSNQTTNAFCNILIYLPNYAGSTNKPWYTDSLNEVNNSTYNELFFHGGLWSNTNAINSLSLNTSESGSTFVQYTVASLYGIKNS
jgi:hypothetical protein